MCHLLRVEVSNWPSMALDYFVLEPVMYGLMLGFNLHLVKQCSVF